MGTRRRRRTEIGAQFVARTKDVLESYAYRVLSLSARKVLDRIELENMYHGGADNGKLPVTYEDFQKYGMDRGAIAPAIREAVALGFLEVTEPGCAGNAEFRSPNKFRLTYLPAHGVTTSWGQGKWALFSSLEDAEAEAKRARGARSDRAYRPSRGGGQKQKASRGKPHGSVGENHTENLDSIPGKTLLQAIPEKTPLLSISRAGESLSVMKRNHLRPRPATGRLLPLAPDSPPGQASNDNDAGVKPARTA